MFTRSSHEVEAPILPTIDDNCWCEFDEYPMGLSDLMKMFVVEIVQNSSITTIDTRIISKYFFINIIYSFIDDSQSY